MGREDELAGIGSFFEQLSAASRTLLLAGEMGIGKTALLRRGAEMARGRGFHVLSAAPTEIEMPLEFAALADLLSAVPAELVSQLPAAQRRAIETAVLLERDPAGAVDPRTIATAMSALLRALAAAAPVLLVVDDIGWLDTPSARVLSFVLRRAGGLPVGLLAAVRSDFSGTSPRTLVDELDPAAVGLLRIPALDRSATAKLLADRRGAPLGRSAAARIHALAGGNPLFALELGAASAPPEQLPASLRRLVDQHLSQLEADEQDLLLLAALSAQPTAALLGTAYAGRKPAQHALDLVVRAGVLVEAGEQLSFAHPVLRSAVVGAADPATVRGAHARLAAVTDRPERRARHLALAAGAPDEAAAAAAEDAARIAADRGASDTAAELAANARRLTPAGRAADLWRRTMQLAEYRFRAADIAGAERLLANLAAQASHGSPRAEALMRLARCRAYLGHSLASWTATLEQAAAEAAGDAVLGPAILRDLGIAANNAGDNEAAKRHLGRALELAEGSGDTAMQSQLRGRLALVHFFAGDGVRHDLLERAIATGPLTSEVTIEARPTVMAGFVLHLTGQLDQARTLYEHEYARASDHGMASGVPILLFGLAETEVYSGNLERAERLVDEGFDLLDDDPSPSRLFITAGRALVHAYRGRADAALADLHTVATLTQAQGVTDLLPLAAYAAGAAGLPAGDYAAVHAQLEMLARVALDGIPEPGMTPFVPDEVEALVRLSRLESAAALLELYERRARETGRGWALAAAARCRALLHAARRDQAGALESAAEALQLHAGLSFPLEHARTLLVAGEIHRRARHRGRAAASLTEAAEIFDRCGAPAWAARARAELSRNGTAAAPRADLRRLTAAEQKVAELAAAGHANADIAAELFMAKRTVEAHLSRVYRKLGVRTRTQMAARLQEKHAVTTDSPWPAGP